MNYVPAELIRKKRFGGAHPRAELEFLVRGFSRGELPDYQIAAWLMAVCFSGMTPEETGWLTEAMRDSGEVLALERFGVTVDKHSTGGLGDKTSLLLAPIVAAGGLCVPMMAGRGLGHTGGTLDKLESLPGFTVTLPRARFERQLETVGAAIVGQTAEMCPADRKLYALRDVTGTVESLPLICASIMSKKLAEGMSALVLDEKYGSGAFMKSLEEAERLALALEDIGRRAGKRVTALLTRMDEPLGRFVGNALEVHECRLILDGAPPPASGKGWDDTVALTLTLAGHMFCLGGKAGSVAEGEALARALIANGRARAKFAEICRAQGADADAELPRARAVTPVTTSRDGFFVYRDVEKIGHALVRLGAGRQAQGEALDFAAGLEVLVVPGQKVRRGDEIFRVHHADDGRLLQAHPLLEECFSISAARIERSPLIAKVLA